jgi:DNA-binding NarL/FixJ family response regulator
VILGVARLACEVEGRIHIVGQAGTQDEALRVIEATHPDVVVLDLELPGADGLDVLRMARDAGFTGRVVVLSDRADGQVVLDATRLDATGFLSKPGGLREIGRAVLEVMAGGRVVDASLDRAAVREVGRLARQVREGAEVGSALTHRERQILTFLAEGMTTQQIARRLRISPRTVESHVGKLYRTLGVRSRVQAVSRAASLGLLDMG